MTYRCARFFPHKRNSDGSLTSICLNLLLQRVHLSGDARLACEKPRFSLIEICSVYSATGSG